MLSCVLHALFVIMVCELRTELVVRHNVARLHANCTLVVVVVVVIA